LLGFGVNLRVQGLLSGDASLVFAQTCTLITSLSEFISVFEQPTLSVVFSSQGLSVIVLVLQTVKMSSSSSNVPKKGRGGRGGVEPGSPAGVEPPAANTIPKSFDKQNS